MFQEGVDLSTDMGQPFRCELDFLARPIRAAAINAWSLEAVGPVNFMLKWRYGVPRPEEVAWLVKGGYFPSDKEDYNGVPQALYDKINSMKLKKSVDFTAYTESSNVGKDAGSPMHPSFPAMHSAGSTCSLWVPALYDITADQYLEALRTDYGVAFARTIAGVHYPQDNIAGLNIGQRIIREKLPKFLSSNYKYDESKVLTKVEALSFDWAKVEFKGDTCIIFSKIRRKLVSHEIFLQDAKDSLKSKEENGEI